MTVSSIVSMMVKRVLRRKFSLGVNPTILVVIHSQVERDKTCHENNKS